MSTVPSAGHHAWMPAASCTPPVCVPRGGATVGRARQAGRWAALAALLLVGVLASPVVRGGRPVRLWACLVVRALGVRTTVRGPRPEPGGVLLVARHVSWLDVPLLASVRPARMLAKAEVGRYPVLGALVRRGGTLFVDRARLRELPATVAELAGVLRAGQAVAAFPEGSTWCGHTRGVLRPAVFQAALDAGVPVQPIAVRYGVRHGRRGGPAATRGTSGLPGATVAAFVGDDTLVGSLRRVLAARGLTVELTVLPPLRHGAHRDRRALAGAATAALDTHGNLHGHDRSSGEGGDEERNAGRGRGRGRRGHGVVHAAR